MEFLTWLRSWLMRHPTKEPTDAERSRYTAEVMARVRALGPLPGGSPARAPVRPWAWSHALAWARRAGLLGTRPAADGSSRQGVGWWPRMAMAMATAAGLVFALTSAHQTRRQLAQQPQGVTAAHPSAVLAESPASDEEWLEQTLDLLEQIDEEPPSAETAGDGSNDEEWLDELQWLDERELSTAS